MTNHSLISYSLTYNLIIRVIVIRIIEIKRHWEYSFLVLLCLYKAEYILQDTFCFTLKLGKGTYSLQAI